jgi:hypothetical protein
MNDSGFELIVIRGDLSRKACVSAHDSCENDKDELRGIHHEAFAATLP